MIPEVKAALNYNALALCNHLFPDGRQEHNYFKIGDVHGSKGRSLSVFLDGAQAGRWKDFETGDGGDLIDLIMEAQGCDFNSAISWAKDHFGVKAPQKIATTAEKIYRKPRSPKVDSSFQLEMYLEERGFEDVDGLIKRHRIYITSELKTAGTDLIFPFFDAHGQLTCIKSKPIDYEGDPRFVGKDTKPILFGWQTIKPHDRSVWITEGELDAIACRELGFSALSLPNGANNMKWIEHEHDALQRFDHIAIATDMDDAGNTAATELLDRFGSRAFRVEFPAKDINELLAEKGYEKSREILSSAYLDSKDKAPAQLRSIHDFRADVAEFFNREESDKDRLRTGFHKIDEEDLRISSHNLVLVIGFSGSGKSMWTTQLAANAITQGSKVLIASMEMQPRETLGRLCKQLTACDQPDTAWQDECFDYLHDSLWLFVDELRPTPKQVVEVFEYAYRRYGIDVFLLDSLTNLVGQEDYEGQQKVIEALVQFKLNFPVTIFLVAHTRKQSDESSAPGKFDIKGTSAISDLADVAISVWKNKPKASHIQQCGMLGEQPDENIVNQWDVYIEVLKNRHGMFEGKFGFDFHEKSCQYVETRGASPGVYVHQPRRTDIF